MKDYFAIEVFFGFVMLQCAILVGAHMIAKAIKAAADRNGK